MKEIANVVVEKKTFKDRMSGLFSIPEMGTLIPLLFMFLLIGSVNKNFFAVGNLIDVLRSTSYTFIIAAPLTLLLISGGSDLTVGAVTNLGGVAVAWGMTLFGWGIFPSVIFALVVGGIAGLIKSLVVVKSDLPPFIATLGLQYAINGFVLVMTSGVAVTGLPEKFRVLGQGKAFGSVYWTVIIAVIVGVVVQIILSKTKLGREISAVGGNRDTANLAGINTVKIKFITNIMVSVFAAFAGVMMASRFNSAQTDAGTGTEMTILASVIIGGTSMAGGRGSVMGSLLGCFLLAVINNGLVLMGVSSYYQNLIFGSLLILSLFVDKYRRSKSSGGL